MTSIRTLALGLTKSKRRKHPSPSSWECTIMMDNCESGSRLDSPFLRVQSDRSLGEASLNERIASRPRTREVIAWCIIAVQAFALAAAALTHSGAHRPPSMYHRTVQTNRHEKSERGSPFSINNRPPAYHENKMLEATSLRDSEHSFYDPPTLYSANAGLVSRVWHSNGSPKINPDLRKGSCWCSDDDYCMCTPALAIDLVLTSGPDHVWLVQRADNGHMALMGGFVEVGETVDEAARRELEEEMNLSLPEHALSLLGVYSDPKRDKRKHSVSVVYTMDIPLDAAPNPGDDATKVVRVPLNTIDDMQVWIDHKTVLHDFIESRRIVPPANARARGVHDQLESEWEEPFKRSLCLSNEHAAS